MNMNFEFNLFNVIILIINIALIAIYVLNSIKLTKLRKIHKDLNQSEKDAYIQMEILKNQIKKN